MGETQTALMQLAGGRGALSIRAVSGRHIEAHRPDAAGPPSRIRAAWTNGCRKLRVIANSAAANDAARQP